MTVEDQQELIRLIEQLADRAATCANPVDSELLRKAAEYLIDYQSIVSKEGL